MAAEEPPLLLLQPMLPAPTPMPPLPIPPLEPLDEERLEEQEDEEEEEEECCVPTPTLPPNEMPPGAEDTPPSPPPARMEDAEAHKRLTALRKAFWYLGGLAFRGRLAAGMGGRSDEEMRE